MNDKYFPLIKDLIIEMIQAFRNYQTRQYSAPNFYDTVSKYYDSTNLRLDIHNAFLDIDNIEDSFSILGVRREQYDHYTDLKKLINQSYRVIINSENYFICSSNIGLFDQMIDDRNGKTVIDIPTENLEEWKFQQSTVLDNVALDAMNLEEYLRDVLTTKEGEHPFFILVDYPNLKELDNIGTMLNALREYNALCK